VIHVLPGISIPEDELRFAASRSGGPGGQNVNKVSSRVTLTFDVQSSTALSDEHKQAIMKKLAARINKDGVLRVVSQRTRSQELNRADTIDRFSELIRGALTPQRPRIRTRVSAAAQQRRMEEKKKRGSVKHVRSKKGWNGDI
jgi:ribosome-associated protein